MTVAVVALALALVGSMGVNVWLLYGRVSDKDKAADSRIAQILTEAESERTHFELETVQRALVASDHVIDGLEATLASYLNHPVNGDLAGDDVDGRVLRLAVRLGQAARAGRALPAEPAAPVPADPAAGEADADLSSPTGVDGV